MEKAPRDTAIRVANASEETLAKCIKQRVWAGRKTLPRNWTDGQLLLIKIGPWLAAIGLVKGEMAMDQDSAFDQGFPALIPVQWIWTPAEKDRLVFDDWVRPTLDDAWGSPHGLLLLNQSVLPAHHSEALVRKLVKRIPAIGR